MKSAYEAMTAMQAGEHFFGLNPLTGNYDMFSCKEEWVNFLQLLDLMQNAAVEERQVFENPWHLAVQQSVAGKEIR